MDLYLFQKINNFAGQWFFVDNLEIFFAKYLIYILAISALLIFWKKWKAIFLAFLSVIFAGFLVEFIRWLWFHPRPFVNHAVNLLIHENPSSSSFPSGHATISFVISAIVYSYNKKAGLGFFIASFLISISRVFVGVHWPSDVLVGALIGIFAGWLVVKISKKF